MPYLTQRRDRSDAVLDMAWTPDDMISEIAAARGRRENGLNLPFSKASIVSICECFPQINPDEHTFVHWRNAVAVSLGYSEWNPPKKATLSINQRLDDENALRFLIEDVEGMCERPASTRIGEIALPFPTGS